MQLIDRFNIVNGIATSDLKIHRSQTKDRVAFLRPASTQLRTISGWVDRNALDPKDIHPRHSLFVSTNGEGSHSYAYVSDFEFAANSDVAVLREKSFMSLAEKIYFARAITMNRFKFSYGRKPKGTRLGSIELPPYIPNFAGIGETNLLILPVVDDILRLCDGPNTESLPSTDEEMVTLDSVFTIDYGHGLELNRQKLCSTGVNFISRTAKNNGVSARIEPLEDIPPHPGGVLTVAGSGSVLETFMQTEPFYSGYHLFCLTPKTSMSFEHMLYYATCIRENQWRYSYGRQANRSIHSLLVPSLHSIPGWVLGAVERTLSTVISSNK